jgi:hypothetical protein
MSQAAVGRQRCLDLAGVLLGTAKTDQRATAHRDVLRALGQRGVPGDRPCQVPLAILVALPLGERAVRRRQRLDAVRVVRERARRVDADVVACDGDAHDARRRRLRAVEPPLQVRQPLVRRGHRAVRCVLEALAQPLPFELAVLLQQIQGQPAEGGGRNQREQCEQHRQPHRGVQRSAPHGDWILAALRWPCVRVLLRSCCDRSEPLVLAAGSRRHRATAAGDPEQGRRTDVIVRP